MTGESDEYYRYLMGLAPRPMVYAAPAAAQADATPLVGNTGITSKAAQYPDYYKFLMGLRPELREPFMDMTPQEYAEAQFQEAVNQANRVDNQGPGAPTPAEANPISMGHALSGVNGSLNPVAQAMSNLAQDLGMTNNPLSIGLGLLGAAGGNPLALLPIASANAAEIDPTNPSSINAQNAMDVGAHPALGFGSANNINAQIGSMGAHASNTPSAAGAGVATTTSQADLDDAALGQAMAALSDPGSAGVGSTSVDIGGIGASIGDAVAGISDADVSAAADAAGAAAPTSAGDYARGGLSSLAAFANGGYNLGDYSDGGRLLRGPGDGVSDSIPASIGNKRPARLADGEFVVPARIVSELGNGSTEAGARKLYAMMDRVQQGRSKTTGKGRVAVNSRSDRYLPA